MHCKEGEHLDDPKVVIYHTEKPLGKLLLPDIETVYGGHAPWTLST
jgi:hypothetical protein